MGEQIILTLFPSFYSSGFFLPAIQHFFNTGKSYEDISHSPPYVSVITGYILTTVIRFARNYLLLASNNTFMTDSQYLGTIQNWGNLNEHHYYLSSAKSLTCEIDENCFPFQSLNLIPFHIMLERLKLIYYSLI